MNDHLRKYVDKEYGSFRIFWQLRYLLLEILILNAISINLFASHFIKKNMARIGFYRMQSPRTFDL
jgi:hypothetical protein